MIQTYWSVCNDALCAEDLSKADIENNVLRRANCLAASYGFAHSRISSEIEALTLSVPRKAMKMLGFREKPKIGKGSEVSPSCPT
ncbi:hypothetical protein CA12_12830 [Alienimonas californiensis]|uniref:Uncharacterized protein n=2 Tax=Alienimonas californiensis TaxID=2527989 RepID=A0A517P762_9PLAN|nr:hypothetical protein CA12_12830 [Alienimonas californiensis]